MIKRQSHIILLAFVLFSCILSTVLIDSVSGMNVESRQNVHFLAVDNSQLTNGDSVTENSGGSVESGDSFSTHSTDQQVGSGLLHFKEKSFMHAFIASWSVIVVSEIGDKTFFIAAIMAMTHPRKIVFIGAISALALMTILSAGMGFATTVIPRAYTFYGSTLLYLIFGLKMLKEGWTMSPDEGQEELEEVTMELKQKEQELESKLQHAPSDVEAAGKSSIFSKASLLVSPRFLQAFTLTFLGEWGDRSQITTIVLAATENPFGVAFGGTIGHSMCTGVAVLGGQLLAKRISVRVVTLIGAVVFLLFAAVNLVTNPYE